MGDLDFNAWLCSEEFRTREVISVYAYFNLKGMYDRDIPSCTALNHDHIKDIGLQAQA